MLDIPNYFEREIVLLASQFQIALPNGDLTNFQKLLKAFCRMYQLIQSEMKLLVTKRTLSGAEGVQLDGLGEILGLPRMSGQSDESYREDLEFQVFVNFVSGTPEQVIKIIKFLTEANKVWYTEFYPAAYMLTTDGLFFPDPPQDLVPAIQSYSPAGVEFIGVTAIYDTNPFSFSSDPFTEQLYVAPDPNNPLQLNPLEVDPGSGAVPFFIQRGQTTDPDFGGGFSEALGDYPSYTYDNTGAGQLAEFIQ